MEILLPILLVFLGIGLVVVEVYVVPGFNVVGILGFLLIVFAIGLGFSQEGWTGGFLALGSTVGLGSLVAYMMWKTGAWERFVLATSLAPGDSSSENQADQRAQFLGKTGVALTPLRPTGVIEIDGERVEAVTGGEFISAGSQVRVMAMDRRRIFVRLSDPNTSNPVPTGSKEDTQQE